jgi:hypothetical protein
MSIYGITGGSRLGLPPERGVDSTGGREAQPARSPAAGSTPSVLAPREPRGLEPAPAPLPAEAPAGTDPELWSVLTGEERAFYARTHALGPLTYGRGEARAPQETMARGVRLDLRV